MELELLKKAIKTIQDFPKPGITYRDFLPIYYEPSLVNIMINLITDQIKSLDFNLIIGLDSRGFLIAPLISQKLNIPMTVIRKKGKLPGEVYQQEYGLEYGTDIFELSKSIPHHKKVLIVDDLLATGGTALAASFYFFNSLEKLVEQSGSQVAGYSFIIELEELKGRAKLDSQVFSLIFY